MKDLLDKLSSYNLFNYLFPGVLFVLISNFFTDYNFIQENDFIGVFLYYFIGMIISRFGSLIIEPILKAISFVKFLDYEIFIKISKNDEKIELLSEANNTYRTISAMLILLLLLKLYNWLQNLLGIQDTVTQIVLLVLILLLFLFSYKKQTKYIVSRIDKQNK